MPKIIRRKTDVEFAVNEYDPENTGDDADIVNQDIFEQLPDAQKAFKEAIAPVELEMWTSRWGMYENGDWTLLDRKYETMDKR